MFDALAVLAQLELPDHSRFALEDNFSLFFLVKEGLQALLLDHLREALGNFEVEAIGRFGGLGVGVQFHKAKLEVWVRQVKARLAADKERRLQVRLPRRKPFELVVKDLDGHVREEEPDIILRAQKLAHQHAPVLSIELVADHMNLLIISPEVTHRVIGQDKELISVHDGQTEVEHRIMIHKQTELEVHVLQVQPEDPDLVFLELEQPQHHFLVPSRKLESLVIGKATSRWTATRACCSC